MQRFSFPIKWQSFKRFNSTKISKSLTQTLNDANKYFGSEPNVSSKIKSIEQIIPKNELSYHEFNPSAITLGIIQSKNIKPGLFIDSLIVDPLSSDNKTAYLIKEYRKLNPQSNLKITKGEKNEMISSSILSSKSPILDNETRLIQNAKLNDGSNKLLNRDLFNNLSFIEVNDKQFNKHIKIEGAEQLHLGINSKDDQIKKSDIQLWMYVTSPNENIEKMNDFPYFILINNSKDNSSIGTSLQESLEENSFEVDLEKLNHANNLITENINNISEYLKLYQQSNMNELLFTINRETSGYKPLILLLRSLIRDLKINEASNDITISTDLKQEIIDWSQNSHFELQSKVTPFLENVLVKDLTKISQLILNSGDLTLVISNLLNGTRAKVKDGLFSEGVECYGLLQESISKSHYLEGKIDALFPETVGGAKNSKSVAQIIDDLQSQIANEKLPELQNKINKFLINEIIAVPFTIFALCNVGYLYGFIQLNTSMAIIALSIAMSANSSQKKIVKIISKFKDWYLEQLRVYIEKTTLLLGERLNENVTQYNEAQNKKQEIVNELKSILVDLESADNDLKQGVIPPKNGK